MSSRNVSVFVRLAMRRLWGRDKMIPSLKPQSLYVWLFFNHFEIFKEWKQYQEEELVSINP
jgi:hypothetical protein